MSTRQEKVSRLIQKEISDWFQRDGRSLFPNALITVTVVRITPDLGIARIYLSLFNIVDKKTLLEKVGTHTNQIRRALGNKIKNQLRVVPELHFYIDDSLDYAERIDELLKK